MAEQKGAGTDVPGRHTEAALAVRGQAAEPGEGREPEAREAEAAGSGPRPDDRSGIQWWLERPLCDGHVLRPPDATTGRDKCPGLSRCMGVLRALRG